MKNEQKVKLIVCLVFLYILHYTFIEFRNLASFRKSEVALDTNLAQNNNDNDLRDFRRYSCNSIKRIGGNENNVRNAPDSLWRVDGAWYVCFDKNLVQSGNCNILSFGINTDPSFDKSMIENYKCHVHSFDPYIEDAIFESKRNSDKNLENSASLSISPNWMFHRIGITGSNDNKDTNIKIGSHLTLNEILDYTHMNKTVIDIFKMDIEGPEWRVLETLDIDYACQYFKQILFETHIVDENSALTYTINNTELNFKNYRAIKKLEKCFLLFHRDTRFYNSISTPENGCLTEFQMSHPIDVRNYGKNELELMAYIISMGELYFVNKNFL